MKNYLEARREELRKRGDKGFTLMEMLIVVAIIAVLIAIAIPVFTGQLERARESTDGANIRSAYSEAMVRIMTDPKNVDLADLTVNLQQQQDDWQNSEVLTSLQALEEAGNAATGDMAVTFGNTLAAAGQNTTAIFTYEQGDASNPPTLTITIA